jgi:hypothetical protein
MLSNHPSVLGSGTAGVTTPAAASAALDLISTTQGAVLYRDATEWTALTPGTAGQLLSTQGAAANPSWVSATGGEGNVSSGAATDNAIVRYDGVSGETVQNSAITIADTTGAMTWATGQAATLTGGDSGASLALGATTSGVATLNATSGGAVVTYTNSGAVGGSLALRNGASLATNNAVDLAFWTDGGGSFATPNARIRALADGSGAAYTAVSFWTYAGSTTEKMRLTPPGDLLIGTASTTGLSGSGNLKVAGTTSATSSTAGTVLVGNGTAATNVAIGGGNINAGGTGTFGGATLVDASGQGTSQFRVKSTANGGMFSVDAYATNNVFAGFDSDFVSPGHIARDTTAALIYKQSGRLSIYGNSGLTSGNTYTPTERVRFGLATGDASFYGAATFAGAVTTQGIAVTSSTTLSGAGAIPITTSLVKYTSTGGAQALTLADGVDGQRLTIVHDVDGGSGVLTPTTKTGFSTITFTNAGDTVDLVYVTTRGWMVTGSYLATIAP